MTMTTIQAIKYAKENPTQKIALLSLKDTYLYTNNGTDFNLIINGSHSLGFAENHDKHVENDLAFYTKGIYWLKPVVTPDLGTTVTYQRAVKRFNKVFDSQRS